MIPYLAGVIILPIIMGISIATPFDEPLTQKEVYTDFPGDLNGSPPREVFVNTEQDRDLIHFFLAIIWMIILLQMLRRLSGIKRKQKKLE